MQQLTLNPDAAYREVAGEVFIVTPDRALHHLSLPTAVTIVQTLRAGPVDAPAIVSAVTARFDVDEARAHADVSAFLKTLMERAIVLEVSTSG